MAPYVLLTSTALLLVGYADSLFNLLGEYELILKEFTHCLDQGTKELRYDLKMHKVKSGQIGYSGNISIPYDMDDNLHAKVDIAKWGSSGWGLNAFSHYSANQCKSLQRLSPGYFKSLTAAIGVKPDCPISKGHYPVKDWIINMAVPFPSLPYGRYRVDVVSSNRTTRLGCVRWLLDINQKAAN